MPETEAKAELAAIAEVNIATLQSIKQSRRLAVEEINTRAFEKLGFEETVLPDDQAHEPILG